MIKWLIAGFFLAASIAAAAEEGGSPPNIVLFFSDDLGYADLGAYGHPYAKTPALDTLAEEGTRFEQHYVTGITCNPSRTGLMTGLFPARFERKTGDYGFGEKVTITRLLNDRGYAVGHFGKWHIGPKEMAVSGTYGIDVVDIIGKSRNPAAGRDDDLTSAAIEFIREKAGKQPFYVNIWGHSTHYPVSVSEELAAEFSTVEVDRGDFSETMQAKFDLCLQIGCDLDESMRQYLGDVWSVDRNVARLLQAIDELGLRDNTIFVYSSDHGPAPVKSGNKGAREYSGNMLGYAGVFRGGKHEQYEGGVRVPMIVRWPGRVPAGRVDTESVTSFIDWLPTLAAITGIEELPEELDGEDVSGAWLGESHQRNRPLYWKTSSAGSGPSMRHGKWKLHMPRKGGIELYDLSVDPSESKNVAGQYPEVLAELEARTRAWVSELPGNYDRNEQRRNRKRGN